MTKEYDAVKQILKKQEISILFLGMEAIEMVRPKHIESSPVVVSSPKQKRWVK